MPFRRGSQCQRHIPPFRQRMSAAEVPPPPPPPLRHCSTQLSPEGFRFSVGSLAGKTQFCASPAHFLCRRAVPSTSPPLILPLPFSPLFPPFSFSVRPSLFVFLNVNHNSNCCPFFRLRRIKLSKNVTSKICIFLYKIGEKLKHLAMLEGENLNSKSQSVAIGCLYIGIALVGLILNSTTCVMIASKRVYRLSAYTIMANVALADCAMLIVAGVACGCALITSPEAKLFLANNTSENADQFGEIDQNAADDQMIGERVAGILNFGIAFGEISSWTTGVLSYAYLGINRCVAIRFYGTRAKQLNQVWVALIASALSWAVGFALAFLGTFPVPLVAIQPTLWTVGMREDGTRREALLTRASLALLGISVAFQWICSTLVLHKIFVVRKKIICNKLGADSANRFRKQARLTFQFFYPSLFCAASSALQFVKPLLHRHFRLANSSLIALHLFWLLNHACNPIIYAYFNERMRSSYVEMFSCAFLRSSLRRRKRRYFDNPLGMSWTTRLCAFAGLPMARIRRSVKRRPHSRTGCSSTGAGNSNGNFVRSSLQLQSRDFEQLCEFMMRVNPLNDSSEGWRESVSRSSSPSSSSSGEEEGFWPGRKVRSEGGLLSAVEAIRRLSNNSISIAQQSTRQPSRSIVLLNMDRTMEKRHSNKGSI